MTAPSPWLEAWLPRLEGPVLDLACGRGRHARAVAAAGHRVMAIDRDAEALAELRRALPGDRALVVQADLEGDADPPLRPGAFGAVLVFRYLHRPLCPAIAALLRPGGLLLYETFTTDQRRFGRGPRRAEFLLRPGELPTLFRTLRLESFEESITSGARPEAVARLAARAP